MNDLIDWWPPEELLPLTVVCKSARGTIAVLNYTDDDSDDEYVTEGPLAVWLEHITHDYKLRVWTFVDTLLAF